MALVVARETVIRDLIPRRPRGDKGVELWADTRLAVERAEADRDFIALWPLRTEQARAADRAEGLHASAAGRPEDADQLLAGEQAEPRARDASLCPAEGARVLSAPRAVAVVRPAEGCRHLESDAAAEARALEWVLGARLCRYNGAVIAAPHMEIAFHGQSIRVGVCASVLPLDGLLLGPLG
jgi:hypothetical protein